MFWPPTTHKKPRAIFLFLCTIPRIESKDWDIDRMIDVFKEIDGLRHIHTICKYQDYFLNKPIYLFFCWIFFWINKHWQFTRIWEKVFCSENCWNESFPVSWTTRISRAKFFSNCSENEREITQFRHSSNL